MNIGQNYAQKQAYVEVLLSGVMRVKTGFDYIKYAREFQTEGEYIRIGDLAGRAVTLDVTAMDLESIMMIVCDYIVSGPVGKIVINHIIYDEHKLIQTSKLFKGVA